jgi:regulator of protease activity HflC (stomatin/prohibitin superfamily)
VRDKIYAAYYALANTEAQMKAYVCDTIRSSLCHLTLDAAFESKEDIANELKKHLTEVMTGYGISIVTALVTDLNPDAKVSSVAWFVPVLRNTVAFHRSFTFATRYQCYCFPGNKTLPKSLHFPA